MRGHAVAFPDLILDDETEDTALIAVQGPAAVALVDGLSDRDLAVVPRFGVEETTVAGIQAMAARTGYTGEDGYELFCHADHATLLWQALANGGAVPCGLGARDTLRLEAALPLYGHEMDETVHPFEARLGWVVRLDKDADFLGKTALRDLQGAPRARTLVGLAMGDRAVPRDGYDLFAGEARVGHVTSGTFSPTLGKGIALARIEAARVANDRPLDVMIRGVRHPARTVKLPFYKNV
jgi:aminomethyltransferase